MRGANPSARRPDGVPGLETNSIVVRGVMQSRGAWLAMVAGADGNDAVTVSEWATSVGTIDYEIVCGMSARMERRYL